MLLGVDLGEKTTGLATSDSSLATPFKTITHKTNAEALEKITKEIDDLGVNTVVVGFVEGKIKPFFENFVNKLQAQRPSIKTVVNLL